MKEKFDYPALFGVIVISMAFTYFNWVIGIITTIVTIVALGWKNRHKGPFPTNKKEKI